MTVHDVLALLYRRKGVIITSFAMICVFVIVFAYILPPGYRSTASVLVERTAPTAMAMTYAPNQEMVEILNTEAAIVRSRPVLEAVIDELALDQRGSEPRGLAKALSGLRDFFVSIGLTSNAPPREKWIATLERRLLVNPGIQSSVLTIGFSNTDPVLARNIVDATTRAYIDRHREIFADEGLPEFYAARVAEVEASLERNRRELASRDASEPENENLAISLRTEISQLKAELAIRQAELDGALERYLPGHPNVRRARAQVLSLRSALRDAEARLQTVTEVSPENEQLRSRIASEESSLQALKAEYESAVTRQRSQSSFLDVRLVSPANLPAKPTISRLFIIVLGVFSGAALAIMFAVIIDYLDERTFDPVEIEDLLGLPCVGVLPNRLRLEQG